MKLSEFVEKHGDVTVDEGKLKELLGVKGGNYFYPKHHSTYFLVDRLGEAAGFVNQNSSATTVHFKNNELFPTSEEAEEHAKKQRFLLKMKRDFLDNSDEIDWNDSAQGKYILTYDAEDDEVISSRSTRFKYAPLATTNEEWLEEYIEKYEDEIKRYYFEIKEEKQNE